MTVPPITGQPLTGGIRRAQYTYRASGNNPTGYNPIPRQTGPLPGHTVGLIDKRQRLGRRFFSQS